jgi:hypothetical protein
MAAWQGRLTADNLTIRKPLTVLRPPSSGLELAIPPQKLEGRGWERPIPPDYFITQPVIPPPATSPAMACQVIVAIAVQCSAVQCSVESDKEQS